jgi:hypothetical protein
VKALPLAETAGPVGMTGTVAVFEERKAEREAGVLEVLLRVSTPLPTGWSAEVGPGSIVLSWRTDQVG